MRAARYTSRYIQVVGQQLALSKCVLLSIRRAIGSEMRSWIISDEDEKWSVELDVRDLGGHVNSTQRGTRFRVGWPSVYCDQKDYCGMCSSSRFPEKLRIQRILFMHAALYTVLKLL